ncbi:MAG TPA: peptidyl-prolyl cis-trans isomerase [Nitrospirota bacterium]|nr:peptidyl-prolyl cis-trans isomerase [Nitrospirota bacterium]
MKAWFGVPVFFFLLGMAAGNTAFAIDSQQAVSSQGTGTTAPSEGPQVVVRAPIFSPLFDRIPLAVVNDDPVTMGDLTNALAESHEERDPARNLSGGKIDFAKILDRLINVRLVVQEAVRIGFDEQPEFKASVDDFSTQSLAKLLMREATKDIKADPVEVEKRYKDSVVEWKIKSVFFEKEDDAKSMADGIKAGKSYEELAEKAIAEEKAKGMQEGNFVKPKDLAPHIQEAVATMETGSVSPVIKVQAGKTAGFTVLKLEEKRYPESPEMRDQAQWSVLGEQRTEAWEKFKTELVKKHVKINNRTLGKLDYEASLDKFPKLLEDTRVVAEIKGEKPVTVGDLTDELQKKFWHGVEEAAKSKKLNKQIRPSLFALLGKRVIAKEVSDRGLANSEEFRKELREYKDQTLFGMFVERVVFPDVKVTEEDLKTYYEKHKQEFQYPEMMKMSSVAFGNKRDAEAALAKLKKGTDMAWVRSNAEGVAARSEDDPLSHLNGSILSVKSLPAGMAKTVTGAHGGEYRLYEGTESGRFYVLSIEDAVPARQQPYEEVREQFRQKAFQEKFSQAMEDWFHKLRSASKVKVYLSEAGK